MAELENDCCRPEAQADCCQPEAKASCCGDQQTAGCGCVAGESDDPERIRDAVREKYAAAATAVSQGAVSASCSSADQTGAFGSSLYEGAADGLQSALDASLGCGVPTSVADLDEGEQSSILARAPALTC